MYRRSNEEKEFLIIINLTDKERPYPFQISQEVLISNYKNRSKKLRPYEADIFEVK